MCASQPRRCGTCAFHQPGPDACSGKCRHPQRRVSGVALLIREHELACRTAWGEDLWEELAEDEGSYAWRPAQGEYDIPDNLPPGLIDMLWRRYSDDATW